MARVTGRRVFPIDDELPGTARSICLLRPCTIRSGRTRILRRGTCTAMRACREDRVCSYDTRSTPVPTNLPGDIWRGHDSPRKVGCALAAHVLASFLATFSDCRDRARCRRGKICREQGVLRVSYEHHPHLPCKRAGRCIPSAQMGATGCESCTAGSKHIERAVAAANHRQSGKDPASLHVHLQSPRNFVAPRHPVNEGKMNCVECMIRCLTFSKEQGLAMARHNEGCADCHGTDAPSCSNMRDAGSCIVCHSRMDRSTGKCSSS